MAVLDSSQKQSIVISTLLTVLVVASVMLSLLLIGHAAALSQSTGTSVVAIGPLKLVEITKLPLEDGGYRAGFRFLQTGILQYFGLSLLAGLFAGLLRGKLPNHR